MTTDDGIVPAVPLHPESQARGTLVLGEEAWAHLVPHLTGVADPLAAQPIPEVDVVLRGVVVGPVDVQMGKGDDWQFVVEVVRVREVTVRESS